MPNRILTALLALTGVLAGQERRPMTADDALRLVSVQDVALSPDGAHMIYTERRLDWEENGYERDHWLVPTAGGDRVEFVGDAGGQDFVFSPDGGSLAFLRDVDDDSQIHLLPMDGGEARALTDHDGGVDSFRWCRDGSRIFFTADEQRTQEEQAEWDNGGDAYAIDDGPNGKSPGRWNNLWYVDASGGDAVRVTDDEHLIGGFDPSPDGTRVVFTAKDQDRVNWGHLSELYLVTVGEEPERISWNAAPEDSPRWSPDGERLVFVAPHHEFFDLTIGYFWLYDPEHNATIQLAGQPEGELAGDWWWAADGRSILFSAVHGTDTNLHRISIPEGEVTRVTDARGTLRVLGVSDDGARMVYSHEDFTTPSDLWASDLERSAPVRLTDANPWVREELLLGRGEVVRWESTDGVTVEGTLVVPPGPLGDPPPLMLNIHGGPSGYWGNEFDPSQHVFAGLGWAVLGPNVRGSTGYGDAHLRGLMGDVGGGEYRDLMTGVDWAIERGVADPDRLALRGWSWGGVLGGWTITQTERFKAASLGAMVCDWTAETGPGFNFDLTLWYIGSTHWDDPEGWRRASSITYVADVSTPTLLLHGARDTTSSTRQSLMFFTALKDRGVPARYVTFPRERHGLREPRHRRARVVEEVRWMQRHVLGEEWEPWSREEPSGRTDG